MDRYCRGANGKSWDLEMEDSLERVFVRGLRKYFSQNIAFARGLSIAEGQIVTQKSRRKVEGSAPYVPPPATDTLNTLDPTYFSSDQRRIRHLRYTKGDREYQIGVTSSIVKVLLCLRVVGDSSEGTEEVYVLDSRDKDTAMTSKCSSLVR